MRKYISKKSIVLVALALLLTVAVGTTLAYIFTKTNPVQNTFKPSKVSCAVVENGSTTENKGNIVYTGYIKSNVQIKNTGDTDAYIRVAVVITWKSADGTKVWAQKPGEGDYTMKLNLSDNGWVEGTDGYYYFTKPVSANGGLTDVLITSATQLKDGPKGTENEQYYLSIEIVASAIQADGMGASSAQEAWAMAKKTQGSN